jgi:predicted MFS family arabinose efflux permease
MNNTVNATAGGVQQPLEWSARGIMLLGGLMVALALSAINSVLPQIEAELAHSAQDSLMIKQLIGIVGLSMVIGAPMAGFLVDRLGARSVILIAGLLFAAIGTAGMYLTSLPMLIASRFCLGITAVTITTTAMTMINTRLSGLERARWMGMHVGAAMIGSIFVHPVAGYLGEFGWRWPFALYGIGVPFGLLALGLSSNVVARQRASASQKGPGLLSWFPLRYAVLAVIIGSITYLPMIYVPFLMTRMGITSPTIISLVLTGDIVLGACLALQYGRARRYLSIQGAFAISFACAGIGMTIVALATNLAGVVVGMMAFGVGLGWFVPNLMTAVSQQVPQELQGRATGFVKGAHHLAAPLCILVVEPFARRLGPEGAMMAAAVLAFSLLVLMSYRLIADRQRDRATAAAVPGA